MFLGKYAQEWTQITENKQTSKSWNMFTYSSWYNFCPFQNMHIRNSWWISWKLCCDTVKIFVLTTL
jgi:hypothetical protein